MNIGLDSVLNYIEFPKFKIYLKKSIQDLNIKQKIFPKFMWSFENIPSQTDQNIDLVYLQKKETFLIEANHS